MIPAKDVFGDYNKIDKENISTTDKVWKFIPRLIKIILNTRTNTARIMDKLGIPRDTEANKESKPK